MTADERLALIRVKVERAKQHLRDLEAARDRFLDTKPYVIESKHDPETGYDVFNVNHLQAPPREIGLIAGDVIHNLRSALDHLAFQLVLVNSRIPTTSTCFPIADDASKYKAGAVRKIEGMTQSAKDAIDATKPYEGGTTELWVLHKLDIADKHHALLVTIVSVAGMALYVPSFFRPDYKGVPGFALPNFGKPLENGDVFFMCEPGTQKDAQFAFDVALTEPEIIKGKPLIPFLQHTIDLVDNLILTFRPLLT